MSSSPARGTVRFWRWLVGSTVVLVLLAVSWLVVAVGFVVFPRYDTVWRADAIVVLGPVDPWRVALAEQLVDDGMADTLAFPSWRAGADAYCREDGDDVEVLCFRPQPSTTQGEAAWTKQQAREGEWDTIIVITMDAHIERARYIFGECLGDGITVVMAGEPPPDAGWRFYAHQLVYQTGGWLKAVLVTPGC